MRTGRFHMIALLNWICKYLCRLIFEILTSFISLYEAAQTTYSMNTVSIMPKLQLICLFFHHTGSSFLPFYPRSKIQIELINIKWLISSDSTGARLKS